MKVNIHSLDVKFISQKIVYVGSLIYIQAIRVCVCVCVLICPSAVLTRLIILDSVG